ncbi:MAG: HRDC domain-containing protein [Bacteroidales bacterium]|nr:HRDC domain-containing protein [Bacteroidales bacterium]
MSQLSQEKFQLALDYVQFTDKNIFLTGKAGTGKTTFLRGLKDNIFKRMIVVAPTGVAAINAGGVTIHSFFQLPFGPLVPSEEKYLGSFGRSSEVHFKFSKEKIRIIKGLDLLVIDEISMVRADLLDGIDEILRKYKNRYLPFGGVQLLMIGDLFQLAPVVREEDNVLLKKYYSSFFFFGSRALSKTDYVTIELTHIFRQQDKEFIDILNNIRNSKDLSQTIDRLNKQHIPNYKPKENENIIILTTHNYQADNINNKKIESLPGKYHSFQAKIEGDFPESSFPADSNLKLKIGAQVMFIKNDGSFEKRFYNGKIGVITAFEQDTIVVKCPDDDYEIDVEMLEWKNMKYEIEEETKEIKEKTAGIFTQFPLKLAWAITIHKSQGLTFDKAVIDARDAFAFGQVYVALSRCRTLEGMVLNSLIDKKGIIEDNSVAIFSQDAKNNQPNVETLEKEKQDFAIKLLFELFDFKAIDYRFNYFLKLYKENFNLIDHFEAVDYQELYNQFKTEILEVSIKFNKQLTALIQSNENDIFALNVKNRVREAVTYFLEKSLSILWEEISVARVESDNVAVKKTMSDYLGRLVEEIKPKLAGLQASLKEFKIQDYISAKAKASIPDNFSAVRKKKATMKTRVESSEHTELYKTLRVWRANKAESEKVKPFYIMHQKPLADLVKYMPVNTTDLAAIKGIGNKKVEAYGEEICGIIKEYVEKNNIVLPEPEFDLPLKAKVVKEDKEDSKNISLRLFREGKSLHEISELRGFALSTISAHLSFFVGIGELKAEEIIEKDRVEEIGAYFNSAENLLLLPAFHALGGKFSFEELRLVAAGLNKEKNNIKKNCILHEKLHK